MSDYLQPKKDRYWTRWGALKRERSTWDTHWQEISTNVLPRNSRFVLTDRNRGQKRHNAIYDSTGTKALRILAAGMMAGMTSPARPWFRLSIADTDLLKYGRVQTWLSDTTKLMLNTFGKSNTYRALHMVYEELGTFGTGATIVQPHLQRVLHHTPLTTGEYCVTVNGDNEVDTLFREFQKPVGALVREFGLDNVSATVRNLYDRGQYDDWITIVHAIEPRMDRDYGKLDNKNMPWSSCYFELEGPKDKFLRESGYKRFPALAPRWQVTGQDIYGSSPAMEALGDIKQLQHQQLRKAQGIDYMVKPNVQGPTALKGHENAMLPGGMTFFDAAGPQVGIRPTWEVKLDLSHLLADIQDVRGRISSAFYADLFLMLSQNENNPRMTATEVAERHEEKLLMIGPVLERLHNELLSPMIDLTFDHLAESGLLPPPPEELHGMDLQVEFVSMLAQAQRAIATNAIDRFVGNLGAVAQIKPEVLDKFDADAWADSYSDMLGVDPQLIVDEKQVQGVRQARAQAQQQAAQAAQQEQASATALNGAKAAQAASQAKPAPISVGNSYDMLNQVSGYGSPSAEMVGS
jgi:hypothetical protein